MLIMTFATKSFASVSAGVTRVAAQGIAGVISFAKAVVNRREILLLTELDDRSLKDIGLMRADVEGALASSWLKDPSSVLASRSTASARAATARREAASGDAKVQLKVAPVQGRTPAPANDHEVACCT